MIDITKIKGIIFDYGGTIDSNGKHWAEVLWEAYQDTGVPVSKEQFREAYVYAERYLAKNPVIKPEDTFLDLLKKKIDLQLKYLVENNFLEINSKTNTYSLAISGQCYNFARNLISEEEIVLQKLHAKYPMVLVSNFYGNVSAVLKDFGLDRHFDRIIESAVVGVRKPDPAIFALGVEALSLPANEVVVIGDSHTKDIIPATANGCKTIWLKGLGWGDDDPEATADVVITDFMELKSVFQID
ncbi:FMN phosphatase YigB (HAD superfamily) [Dysgonomonas sp. PH5-45]|uniref:HAD family hydrolase n=1 Tax=unclassified Dysgonomonas TaxID=2630389 RepID=UPI0024749B32|nr:MULTISPECIES: HAD family hydrolase [unclassified Dysgonomonas]MDH6354910.1 FMN phosphatase YigB (HAD superfamily) [Dysgonomonas sp. PH5-45]MDH6387809.1 FMN phosphatase YigB (HAD superfamily) [Dysgonomonas sp. PH5-37]